MPKFKVGDRVVNIRSIYVPIGQIGTVLEESCDPYIHWDYFYSGYPLPEYGISTDSCCAVNEDQLELLLDKPKIEYEVTTFDRLEIGDVFKTHKGNVCMKGSNSKGLVILHSEKGKGSDMFFNAPYTVHKVIGMNILDSVQQVFQECEEDVQ